MNPIRPLEPVGEQLAREARNKIFADLAEKGYPGVISGEARPWSQALIGEVFQITRCSVQRAVRSARKRGAPDAARPEPAPL